MGMNIGHRGTKRFIPESVGQAQDAVVSAERRFHRFLRKDHRWHQPARDEREARPGEPAFRFVPRSHSQASIAAI